MAGIPNYLSFDGETTGAINGTYGNPFTHSNRLCVVGYGNGSNVASTLGGSVEPDVFKGFDVLVGFNIKFDIHWLRRNGVSIRDLQILS